MKNKITTKIELTRKMPKELELALAKFIMEKNKDLTKKYKDKGTVELNNLLIKNKQLTLDVNTTGAVKAHVALLNIKNELFQKLHNEKIGTKTFQINVTLELIPEAEPDLKLLNQLDEIKLAKLENKTLKVDLEPLDINAVTNGVLDRIIKLITGMTAKGADIAEGLIAIPPGTITAKGKAKTAKFFEDPATVALKKGWIKEWPARGQWLYMPQFTKLYRFFTQKAIELAEELGYQEAMFPKLLPVEILAKNKYIEGLPDGVFYVCAPERNPEAFEKVKCEAVIHNKVPIKTIKPLLKDPTHYLAPAQCEPFYQMLDGERLDVKDLPIKMFDATGYTWRNEGGGVKGLLRVNEFQRVELVFIDTPENCEKIRNKATKALQNLGDSYGIIWKTCVQDDPFYLEGRRVEQQNADLPGVPTYELDAWFPYLGDYEDPKAFKAIGSTNVHGDHFCKGFHIKEIKDKTLWTGCVGIGVTRWAAAILAQYGFDPKDWPKKLREEIGTIPEVTKMTTWPRN
jgi:seryl-tRNA synthetase